MLVRVVVAVVLVTSSVAKLYAPTEFMAVLRELGLRQPRGWWLATCMAELAVVVCLAVPLNPLVPAVLVAFIGIVFAAAGVRGLLSTKTIQCACFGAGHSWKLGWAQIYVLPLWLAAAVAVTWWQPVDEIQGAALAAAVLVVPLLVFMVRLAGWARYARADRLAMAESKGSSV